MIASLLLVLCSYRCPVLGRLIGEASRAITGFWGRLDPRGHKRRISPGRCSVSGLSTSVVISDGFRKVCCQMRRWR